MRICTGKEVPEVHAGKGGAWPVPQQPAVLGRVAFRRAMIIPGPTRSRDQEEDWDLHVQYEAATVPLLGGGSAGPVLSLQQGCLQPVCLQ